MQRRLPFKTGKNTSVILQQRRIHLHHATISLHESICRATANSLRFNHFHNTRTKERDRIYETRKREQGKHEPFLVSTAAK